MDPDFWIFLAVGAAAQLVDGALGMAYGVVSTTALLSLGVPPANASASVHASKVFTGAASAISHAIHKNIDRGLLIFLAIGGVIGGVAGAFLLTSIDSARVKPFVVAWLGLMGLVILWRAWRGAPPKPDAKARPLPLGMVGGFLDSIGGGGWGPVVTSTLLGSGTDPRKAIGTTNAAEFFVACAVSTTFITAILTGHWEAGGLKDHIWSVAGLVVGGVLAAPVAGWTTKVLPLKVLTWVVGFLVTGLAIWQGVMLLRG